MDRRSFLAGGTGLAVSSLLAGCSSQQRTTLTVRLLKGSIPAQVISAFQTELKRASSTSESAFAPELQLQVLFSLLQTWKLQANEPKQSENLLARIIGGLPIVGDRRSRQVPDLVTLGDFWLQKAIQQQLIQPFEPDKWAHWKKLPQSPQWQALVRRNKDGRPDSNGQIWAAPYRVGTTLIAYRQDIFQKHGLQPPTDWDDLWRAELAEQIALLNHPREVIGLVLKKLGQSYNQTNLDTVSGLKAELETLRPQVKLYSSNTYLQPLLLGDVWLAVGWSADILPLLSRSQTIRAVVPRSGTALWADLWVRPFNSKPQTLDLAQQWIDFCWRPEVAQQLSTLSRATSPVILNQPQAPQSAALQENPLLLPDVNTLNASEFLLPLPNATVAQYQNLWETLRRPG